MSNYHRAETILESGAGEQARGPEYGTSRTMSYSSFAVAVNSTEHTESSPNILRQMARRALATALPRSMFMTEGPRTAQSVCLTFDDGPHPERTPRILDILAHEGVHATFFVLGLHAERFPDVVKRIGAEGHTVGHHSYSHRPQTSWAVVQEVRKSNQILKSILGQPVRFYRPPHGKLRALDFVGLWVLGQSIVLWNVDPRDFEQPSSERLTDWFKARPLRGGDVVLLHDDELHTAAALPSIIADVRRSGLQFETLSRWTRWLPAGRL